MTRTRLLWSAAIALVPPSLLVGPDLFLNLSCARVPASWYLVAQGVGLGVGWLAGAWVPRPGIVPRSARALVGLVVGCGLLGAVALTATPIPWSSKCAWRYCSRVLRPGLDRSPYPIHPVTCAALRLCSDEYPLAEDEEPELYLAEQRLGCEPP